MRGEVAQGLVGPHGVVGVLPGQEVLVQDGHLYGEVSDFVELFRMGALCPLHETVELGRVRRQGKGAEAPALAFRLKGRLR